MDSILHNYLWMPFKWIGRQVGFFENIIGRVIIIVLGLLAIAATFLYPIIFESINIYLPIAFMLAALLIILCSFSSRKSSRVAWGNLWIAHVFIICAIVKNTGVLNWQQVAMYASGVTVASIVGSICLYKIKKIDSDISLNNYHGYVYEQKNTAFIFLLSALGLLGFPITAAFIGIDVFFTHIGANQYAPIAIDDSRRLPQVIRSFSSMRTTTPSFLV